MTPDPSDEAGSGGRRGGRLFAALLLLAAIAFAALGVWQVERLQWKLDLIARVTSRINAPAQPAPGPERWSVVSDRSDAYRHVVVHGLFLNREETLVQAVTDLGPGFWVLTPLRTESGWTVLVNRGFVPPERRTPSSRPQGQNNGRVTVTGLLRITEPKGGFLRTNDARADRWYSRDVEAIARARGLDKVAPYFIDADSTVNPGGFPVGGLTVVHFRNAHLSYALTWFALAALSLWGLWRLRRPRRAATDPL